MFEHTCIHTLIHTITHTQHMNIYIHTYTRTNTHTYTRMHAQTHYTHTTHTCTNISTHHWPLTIEESHRLGDAFPLLSKAVDQTVGVNSSLKDGWSGTCAWWCLVSQWNTVQLCTTQVLKVSAGKSSTDTLQEAVPCPTTEGVSTQGPTWTSPIMWDLDTWHLLPC